VKKVGSRYIRRDTNTFVETKKKREERGRKGGCESPEENVAGCGTGNKRGELNETGEIKGKRKTKSARRV